MRIWCMDVSEKENKAVTTWLFVVCGLIMFMVVLGGYVRLTRSGLSMVEWEPVRGIIPPIGEQQWQEEFAKYQATPEFKIINKNMTLEGYKNIFYVEYIHRLLARFAGLVVVIPLFYFILKGIIPWSWYMARTPSNFVKFEVPKKPSAAYGPNACMPSSKAVLRAGMIISSSSFPSNPSSPA